ncbi:Transporter of the ATP-binding cassette (ABC), partial [Friedmanniomyces endolithicus]
MFARPEYIWKGDDFSRAFEQDYLQTLLPLISCAFSLLYLTYQIARSFDRSRNVHPYHALQGHVAGGARLAEAAEEDGGYDEESEDEAEDEMGRNQQLALHPTPSQIHRSILKVDKPAGELVIAVLEVLAVFAEVGTQIAALILHAWGRKGTVAAAASVAVWVYIAVLASLRLLFSSNSKLSFPKLWYHTTFLYGFQWLCTILVFRSQIIHPRSSRTEALASVHFALVTLLTIIALTSRKGNRVVQLEYEGDLAPSREPLASVLSLATFSWVDSIVWRGYQKTTEMSDVWNL